MNQNFEQDIPVPVVIAAFVVILIVSNVFRSRMRQRKLVKEGQLTTESGRIPSIAERVAGNKAWANGEILSKGRNFMIVLLVSAILVNLTLLTGFIKYLSNPDVKTAPLIVLGVFTALGIAFGIFAVRVMLRYFRFGQSSCRIHDKAGVLGKAIKGVIRSQKEIEATGDYTIELQCLETYSTGSGKNRKTEIKIHWQSKQQVPHTGKSSKVGINFSFELPPYPPETGYQLARGNVYWQLKIHAPVKGVDYAASFIVPVFKMDYSA